MATRIILSSLWSLLLLMSVSCVEKHQKRTRPISKDNDEIDKHFFGGLFPGKCGHDGVYIRDAYSLVFCSNMNKYVQPCAPGTRNGPLHAYLPGAKYGPTDFCNVNLVPYGDTPYMYPILQYGGLPLPFQHTQKGGYIPYIFLPKQIYPSRKEPKKHKAVHSGYLHPLDGHKVVETIKDTHLYEKPDAVHGYHSNDIEKDYNAIRLSYDHKKQAEEDFRKAYKEVNKEIHDDYKPEYKDEFEKFAKNFNVQEKPEKEYNLNAYDEDAVKYGEKDKKMKYKETRYAPPLPNMKPNKYGEIKDLPPKYMRPKKYRTPENLEPKYKRDDYNKDVHKDHRLQNPKINSENSYHPTNYPYPTKYEPNKYESPPYEPSKVYKPIEENDEEFDVFYNSNDNIYTNMKIKGATYSDDSYGEYGVGRVEKAVQAQKPKTAAYSVPLKEEIHGAQYI